MKQVTVWLFFALMLGLFGGLPVVAQTEWTVGDTQYLDYVNQDRIRDSIDFADTYVNQAVTERLVKPPQRKTGGMEEGLGEDREKPDSVEAETPEPEVSVEVPAPAEDDAEDFTLPDLSSLDFSQDDTTGEDSPVSETPPVSDPGPVTSRVSKSHEKKTAQEPSPVAMPAVGSVSTPPEEDQIFDFSSLDEELEEAPEPARSTHRSSPF